jgi:hypothetical protein
MAYVVTNRGPLNHDNQLYQEGATLSSIRAEDAAILLELGVIAETQPPAKVNKKDD